MLKHGVAALGELVEQGGGGCCRRGAEQIEALRLQLQRRWLGGWEAEALEGEVGVLKHLAAALEVLVEH